VGLGSPGTLVSGVRLSDDIKVHVTDVSTAATQFPLFAQFSANIAANSEVQGFSVRYERRGNASVTAAGGSERWLRLVSGAGTGVQYVSTTVNANTGAWTTTDTYVTAGGSAVMWGMTTADASAGRVNGPRFGVAIRANYAGGTVTSAAMSIDHIQLQVHYTPPSVSAEPYSAEFDRENFSVPIRPNVIGQSSEYGLEVGSMGVSALALVGTQSAEFDLEASNAALAANVLIVGAEFEFESGQIDLEQPAGDLGVQAPEFGHESGVVGLVLDVAAQTAEMGFETTSILLAANILPDSQEFDIEAGSTSLAQLHLLGVEGPEFEIEAGSVGNALNLNPLSVEFEAEFSSLGLVRNIVAGSFEGDFEAQSVLIAQVALSVDEIETGFEVGDVALVNNLGVEGSEFAFEAGSPFVGSDFAVVPAEFGFETEGPPFGYLLSPAAHEREWEVGSPSFSLAYYLGVSSMEFDRDWGGNVTPIRNRMDWLREIQGKVHRERELRRRKWA
jgi:hypothetical protein